MKVRRPGQEGFRRRRRRRQHERDMDEDQTTSEMQTKVLERQMRLCPQMVPETDQVSAGPVRLWPSLEPQQVGGDVIIGKLHTHLDQT